MKRDMDLIRKLLFKIEDEYKGRPIYPFTLEGYDPWVVKEHCKLMQQQNLIEFVKDDEVNCSPYFYVGNLTADGYDFLDKIRKDTIWNQTKETITQKGLPMILDVVKDVATSLASALAEGAVKGMIGP